MMAAYLAIADLNLNIAEEQEIFPYWMDRVITIDEPEVGLHSTAIRNMFHGLIEWGAQRTVIAATHSAAALRNPSTNLVHVDRDEHGLITCLTMEPPISDLLEQVTTKGDMRTRLGLDPADILQTIRRFVVVEGEHDRAIIEAIVGIDELDGARAKVLPMRGAHNLMSVLGAQLIFDFTSAEILVVLDRVRGAFFDRLWTETRDLCQSGKLREAMTRLRQLEGRSKEERMLNEFCTRAVQTGRYDRITVAGLSKPDIIKYLPVSKIVAGATSWEAVDEGWDGHEDYKDYIRRCGAMISARKLGQIASDLDVLDGDLLELRRRCIETNRRRRSGKGRGRDVEGGSH
jgi:energy-coupling factor transporter ATP-binding protein EcfA2